MWVGVCLLTTTIHYLLYLLSTVGRTLGPVEHPTTGKVSPRNLQGHKWKKNGNTFVMNYGTLLAVKLKGRRVFQMLSSVHSVVDVEVGQNQPGTGHPITKPEIIHDYNKFMGAVDRCDQMVAYSCFRRRTMRWWKKKFFHLFFWSWMLTFSTSKEPGRLCCKGPFKGSSWRSLLGILASPILFKLEVTSQRKYWALGRSSSSPGHMWFAFLP